MASNIKSPDYFEPGDNPAKAWTEWKEDYDFFEILSEFDQKPAPFRKALLLRTVGKKLRDIIANFKYDAAIQNGQETVENIFEKIAEYYKPYKNLTQATAVFNSMVQGEHQTWDDYVTQVTRQAEQCEFGEVRDRMIGDRLIIGIRDLTLQERMLRCGNVTLDKIIAGGKAAEISRQHAATLKVKTPKDESLVDVCAINSKSSG